MIRTIRNFLRGYSKEDLLSAIAKINREKKAGALIPLSKRELRAIAMNDPVMYLEARDAKENKD